MDNPVRIPKVSELVGQLGDHGFPHNSAVCAARLAVDQFRSLCDEEREQVDLVALTHRLLQEQFSLSLKGCFNFTGTILHTGLGRAPLAEAARQAVQSAAVNCLLEFDPESGERGNRQDHVEDLICRLTGAEAALTVNNCAGATILALSALASGASVLLSRGEMIEIGGSFRLPEIIQSSGAHLKEVGCTNRTHLRDYEQAIDEQTAVLLRCHHSNYVISGFTSSPSAAELAHLSRDHGLVFIDDLGSGNVTDLSLFGLQPEPRVQESLRNGADLVLFSGDKLMGGPQAGVICGRSDLMLRIARHPLARALRIDKLSLAALEATLRIHLYGDLEQIPLFEMLARSQGQLEIQARELSSILEGAALQPSIEETASVVGAGSAPGNHLPTPAVRVRLERPQELAKTLRAHQVIGRVADGSFWLDPRSCPIERFDEAKEALRAAIRAEVQ